MNESKGQLQNVEKHEAYWKAQGDECRKNKESIVSKILDAEIAKAVFLMSEAGVKTSKRPIVKKDINDLSTKEAAKKLGKRANDDSA